MNLAPLEPQSLHVVHIFDGQEVVMGGDDGQSFVATFCNAATAEEFVKFCRVAGFHPKGISLREMKKLLVTHRETRRDL